MKTGRPPLARLARLSVAEQLFHALPAPQQGLAAGLALDAVHCWLVATHETLTMQEQAAALNTDPSTVNKWRSTLRAIRRIDMASRAGQKPITLAEIEACVRLFREGFSVTAIASLREVSSHRVLRALRKAGLPAYSPRRQTYSAEQVARVFGIHPVIVQTWSRRGWLLDQRYRSFRGVRYCWSRHDLVQFVRDRRTWIAWEPPQIQDAELKRVAERARAEAGGGWYQQGDVALLLDVHFSTFSTWLAVQPLLGGLEQLPWSGAGPRYVWLTDRQRDQLAAWGERMQRAGVGPARRRLSAELRVWLLATFGPADVLAVAAD